MGRANLQRKGATPAAAEEISEPEELEAEEAEALEAVEELEEVEPAEVEEAEPPGVDEAERLVEEAQEGADGAGRVVVLAAAEEQRAATFEVAQVDVVSERRASGAAARGPPAPPAFHRAGR